MFLMPKTLALFCIFTNLVESLAILSYYICLWLHNVSGKVEGGMYISWETAHSNDVKPFRFSFCVSPTHGTTDNLSKCVE